MTRTNQIIVAIICTVAVILGLIVALHSGAAEQWANGFLCTLFGFHAYLAWSSLPPKEK